MKKGFFLYTDYVETAKKSLSPGQYREYLVALIDLGITGECTVTDSLVGAFLIQRAADINATNRRHKRCVVNGAKGGRPPVVTKYQIINAIVCYQLHTKKELAEHFSCSERTIARKISQEEIEERYKNGYTKRDV